MGRVKGFGKRKSHPNQHNNSSLKESSSDHVPCSSSKKKVKAVEVSPCDMGNNRIIIEVGILSSLLEQFVKCRFCDSINSIVVEEDLKSRKGLASSIALHCKNCRNSASSMSSSTTNSTYDINMRLVYGMRCIGKSKNAADILCGILNLPPPPTKFASLYDKLLKSLETVSDASMEAAVEETVELGVTLEESVELSAAIQETDESTLSRRDISAAFDGTWQKRGHTSKNGVVAATSLETGKVMDVECLSKYCSVCTQFGNLRHHNCQKNYDGSSGGMEVQGVLNIFVRSEATRSVRYVNYLGDGDTKAYDRVTEQKVYGDVTISKLECIAHVQKRMGARLLKLKADYKGKKLSDGKGLAGKNRLTKSEILQFQRYYGLAITQNINKSVKEMSQAVWAIYFHKSSTDDNPNHGLCPTDPNTWCKYYKALQKGEQYKHTNSLPESVMFAIKPVFRALTSPKLLAKCTHGRTQNPNESFNHCIWERLPKTSFVGRTALQIGVRDAVICFNDGAGSRRLVVENLGMEPGFNMMRSLRSIDNRRVTEAERAFKKATKEARINKKKTQRALETSAKLDTSEYGAGAH